MESLWSDFNSRPQILLNHVHTRFNKIWGRELKSDMEETEITSKNLVVGWRFGSLVHAFSAAMTHLCRSIADQH